MKRPLHYHFRNILILLVINLLVILMGTSCTPNLSQCKGNSRNAIASHTATDLPRSAKGKKAHYTHKKRQSTMGAWYDGLFYKEGWHSAK